MATSDQAADDDSASASVKERVESWADHALAQVISEHRPELEQAAELIQECHQMLAALNSALREHRYQDVVNLSSLLSTHARNLSIGMSRQLQFLRGADAALTIMRTAIRVGIAGNRQSFVQWAQARAAATGRKRPVVATNVATGEQLHFDSINAAARTGFDMRGIDSVLKGKRLTYRGYRWTEAAFPQTPKELPK